MLKSIIAMVIAAAIIAVACAAANPVNWMVGWESFKSGYEEGRRGE